MNITVIGAGYVGLTTASLLANADYQVTLIEINPERLAIIRTGRSFFFEQGLDPLINKAIKSGKLTVTDQFDGLDSADIVFSCVGTPDNPDGSSNLAYIFSAAETAAKKLKNDAIYVQKSTVPVGTGNQIITLFKSENKHIHYVSNPEFLRESTAISDALWFDRIVVGANDKKAAESILNIYRQLESKREEIALTAGLSRSITTSQGQYILTSLVSAELIKVTSNAFLALKISFANSIAKLADAAGADIIEVMDAVGADPRIGRAFLNAGRGYGGGCFPKDVSGLISSAQIHSVDIGIMREAAELNASMPGYIANMLQEVLEDGIKGHKIAILGLAFKAGTSDARKSPAVALANLLSKRGALVTAYDPQAIDEATPDLLRAVEVSSHLENCVKGSDVVCVATDWAEFVDYDLTALKSLMRGNIFVDAMNVFDSENVKGAGFCFLGVGRR